MTLTLIKNKEIRSNKKKLDTFLENFHENYKEFTIDCQSLNVDFFNSETIVKVRHRKPIKDSIYYAETYKEKDEVAYFFGLGRENVIATSSYLNRGSQIKPILVAILNVEDSSKSNLVFAKGSDEYFNNVLLLKIDCNGLTDLELKVLKDKNKISRLVDGKGYINFGAIGKFSTLTNIRNFISNVKFIYDDVPFIKLAEVSIPENYNESHKLDDSIVKDRFINFGKLSLSGEDVIDSNELENENILNNMAEDTSISSELNGTIDDLNNIFDDMSLVDGEINGANETENDDNSADEFNHIEIGFEGSGELDSIENGIKDSEEENENLDLYKLFFIDENNVFFELSIYRNDFFEIITFIKNIVDLCGSEIGLNLIEVLDMGDEMLNMYLSINVDDISIDLINQILIKNGFDYRE